MTLPGAWRDPDDPDRIPTQAELDAEDLAELARTSQDRALTERYPRRPDDPGPAPVALTRDAMWMWYLSAATALVCLIYGLATLGSEIDRLTARLEPQMADVQTIDAQATAASIAGFWPPALLIGWLLAMAVTYPLLTGIARHHSRNLRSVYAAVCVVVALFVPLIADLLFAYDEVPAVIRVLAWVSFGALLASVVMTFRGGIGRWLPESMRVKPSRVWRQ
ncbi:hypothetical protein GOHSU_31_00230 [Gordonia hirsuta DSM 44140 = NBRC 16056]|uniref:Uncharacterized protein n=1 Tax=Gordonia hirsuta DSM 44140 = NBRC 16056 TaxID=1121927 RepID=L7LDL8_9ACTN|nr:hypothetical protein [Gordonia hirsuta]GAC58162.1 hypothetical protein GOHSU_31_00230 [Gordonia hirsuta DSM 44140 = NBRC 16056]